MELVNLFKFVTSVPWLITLSPRPSDSRSPVVDGLNHHPVVLFGIERQRDGLAIGVYVIASISTLRLRTSFAQPSLAPAIEKNA